MTVPKAPVAILLMAALLAGCGGDASRDTDADSGAPAPAQVEGDTSDENNVPPLSPLAATTDWQIDTSARGARLAYAEERDDPIVLLTCVGDRLIVRLENVAPITSEERLTIGSGDLAVALVADANSGMPSIAGRGPVPENFETMLEQGFAAAYGSYSTGVLPPVPADSIARWRASCA